MSSVDGFTDRALAPAMEALNEMVDAAVADELGVSVDSLPPEHRLSGGTVVRHVPAVFTGEDFA